MIRERLGRPEGVRRGRSDVTGTMWIHPTALAAATPYGRGPLEYHAAYQTISA